MVGGIDYTHDFGDRLFNLPIDDYVIELFSRHFLLPTRYFQSSLNIGFVGVAPRSETSFQFGPRRRCQEDRDRLRICTLHLHRPEVLDIEKHMVTVF